jgi:hyperosmotically inducible protein
MSVRRRIQFVVLWAVPFITLASCNRQPAENLTTNTTVPASEGSTDASIETSVQARLYAEVDTRDHDIDVRAADGVVTLRGTVGSDAARQQALQIARGTEGVTRVDDQLTIRTVDAAQRGPGQADQGDNRIRSIVDTPAWITTKIQAQYFISPDIKPWNVDVTTTSGGVVELRGEVDDAMAKSEAVRIARATEGVSRVEDYLRVRAGTAPATEVSVPDIANSDTWITAKIQAKYFLDPDVKVLDVDVATSNGVVTLMGTVDSEAERRHAVAIARNTDGVRDVRDDLRVGGDSSEQTGTRPTSGPGIVAGIEDPWITIKIQSKYFLDADVKGHDIDVDTRDGVVTLTGTVGSMSQRQLAEQIARDTDGVSRVVNRLNVSSAG